MVSEVPMDAVTELHAGVLAERRSKPSVLRRAIDCAAQVISMLSRVSGALAAAAIMTMALMTAYDVVMRYVVNSPTTWATETSGYLLIFTAMFGAVYAMHEGGHIAVTLVFGRLSRRRQTALSLVSGALMVVYLAVLFWNGLDMTLTAFRQGGGHIGDMNMPQWLTYQIIPVGGALFGLEVLRQLYVNAKNLRSDNSDRVRRTQREIAHG